MVLILLCTDQMKKLGEGEEIQQLNEQELEALDKNAVEVCVGVFGYVLITYLVPSGYSMRSQH